jgi:hypothetical protein
MTPRKKGSRSSQANKQRVARLRAAGLMSSAGEAAVHRSMLDATWNALNQVEALEEPDDLCRALDPSLCRPRELGRIPTLDTPRDTRVDSGGQATRNSEQANRRYGREGSCQRSRQPMARPQ